MNKLRVLIVDDEFNIAKLIEKLIHWEEFSMECVGLVNNGETAFEIIQKDQPDIVITDIRMPKVNGLDLIRMTKEKQISSEFIVVSGYKEFEYAHQAMQYGVTSYLLKPINGGELNDTLQHIQKRKAEEEQQRKEQTILKETVTESERIIRKDFLERIIDQDENEVAADSRISLEGERYLGIDVKLDLANYQSMNRQMDTMAVEKVSGYIQNGLDPVVNTAIVCPKDYLHIYCLCSYDTVHAPEVDQALSDILSNIQGYLLKQEYFVATIGIGWEKTDFGDMRFSIKEASRAVGNRIKLGTGRLIYAKNIPAPGNMPESAKSHREEIRAALDTCSDSKMAECIDSVFRSYNQEQTMDYSHCYTLAQEFLEVVLRSEEEQNEGIRETCKRISRYCNHCKTVLSLKNCLKKELSAYMDQKKAALESEVAKPIRQAQNYIEEHFADKIVLEDLADLVGLNPAYFSVLFKKETDRNFSAYLAEIRMNKAKEMLTGTNETVAAIGEMVGYKDSRYFSQTFAKMVGVKPALYRKLHA